MPRRRAGPARTGLTGAGLLVWWTRSRRLDSMGVRLIETAYEMRTATATVTPNW